MATYIALIRKASDDRYAVTFPDLPGCATTGKTLHAALATAQEALAVHIDALLKDGKHVPLPSLADAVERGDALVMTTVNVPDNLRMTRVNVSLPALVLSRFDSFAERRGMTRAALLVEALQRFMAEEAARAAQEVRTNPYDAVLSAIEHMRTIGDGETAPPGEAKPEGTAETLRDIAKRLATMADEQETAKDAAPPPEAPQLLKRPG
jgi:predicted RNase H-like HicB family nuclease